MARRNSGFLHPRRLRQLQWERDFMERIEELKGNFQKSLTCSEWFNFPFAPSSPLKKKKIHWRISHWFLQSWIWSGRECWDAGSSRNLIRVTWNLFWFSPPPRQGWAQDTISIFERRKAWTSLVAQWLRICNAGDVRLSPGQGTKIPHDSAQLSLCALEPKHHN